MSTAPVNGRFVEEVYVEDEPDAGEELRIAASANRVAGIVVLLVIGAIASGIAIAILARTAST